MIESHRLEYNTASLITSTGGLSTIKNLDDFFDGYSKPNSREIMRIYKDLELVEHLGSGLNRILSVYEKESFVVKQNYMRNVFYKNKKQLQKGGGVSGGVNGLAIYISENPNLKVTQLCQELEVPQRTVERWLKQLKDENKIEFIGSPKTGGYVAK